MKTALERIFEKHDKEFDKMNFLRWLSDNRKELLKAEKEQMVKFAFDFYYDMSHQNKVPENYITENREHAEIYFDNTFNPKQHQ